MKKKMRLLIILTLMLGICPNAHAINDNNLLYINVNGASSRIINALIDKQKAPTLAGIKQDGSLDQIKYTNLSNETDALMEVIMGDRPIALSSAIRARAHGVSVALIWSVSQTQQKLGPRIQGIKKSFNTIEAETPRTTTEITQATLKFLNTTPGQFALFINYPDANNQAQKYREGGKYYSNALQEIDREIAKILTKLDAQSRTHNTTIIVTTNHSYKPNTSAPDYTAPLWLITNNPKISTISPSRLRRSLLSIFSN